ncbi:MAG: DUF452 family protein [Tannerella sp.]|jgi:biotin synthesis protein BioG|nr:DUF452 family protein [Tannerella sp.]
MIIKKINATVKTDDENPRLLLFFSGWGMDEHPFMEYLPEDMDCMICYDYSSLSFDTFSLMSYKHIRVIAWSMGVWAASRILSVHHLPVSESIAINGTPWPVDDERGIATAIFRGTLDGLNESTVQKFRRRMCGSKEALNLFMEHVPRRTVKDLHEELRRIGECSRDVYEPYFTWDKVYIGLQDKIFLPVNQQKAWEGNNITMIACEHYPHTFWAELFKKRIHE